jgi:anti-sigma factor RsiW
MSATCLDDETIGSFVDGTIDSAGRKRVAAHMASCADCSELVAEVVRTNEPVPRVSRRVYVATAALLVVVGLILFVILYDHP